ncbi:O-sialoglycoprotein endopeptidase [Nonlabens xylanidelens]|uniref:tRNA N6-adenosine threonylcarbamoyltransferase n=1 Tax=Nonlabens xylanidelens TaxID=191564 RepID=A0A2S6IL32_9FLAO|nr:tRNA (adenosine(37)-N6)-threonylcarbamoyltransferase complex transferase subunit TsaD [Nonlabens xylanidelens]PPK94860.1 O-sialoglycoprotein endopeptidase [Nonlabens xylanidelens]PQJ17410.1 tRNA (adenosine(37)-N6)-threonylcarbamoyltransferase complex transferase subunit TsaD [Nonlabens xylanidelens]
MDTQISYILAIESSCDDTSCAVLKNDRVLSNVVAGQEIHTKYGGVVPELASRAHQSNIVPVVDQALKQAGISKENLTAIAFTRGPGLMGSLLVGSSFAKSLSLALNIPLIDVHHMHGHILAHFINEDQKTPDFPFLGVTISGGHTQIVKVTDYHEMEVIGTTQDDAIGEAFDKSGKVLGLGYPAGPQIDKLAQEGDPKKFPFPVPKAPDLNYSFSGFKTAVLYFIQREVKKDPDFVEKNLKDICASIQYTLIKILFQKVEKAVKQTGIKSVAIGGGVSANSGIRAQLLSYKNKGWNVFIPPFQYTTDNAAMIGISGYFKYLEGNFAGMEVTASPRIEM